MPNVLDGLGLQVATRTELVDYFTAQYQAIYGSDINLDSNTPDGQMMNIFIQSILDLEDLLVQIYNSFNPDNAIGVVLDQRVSINGIERQAGTYTITAITVVNTQSVNLYGIDGDTSTPPVRDDGNEIYTISDNAGNKWLLVTSQLGVAAGTHSYDFRAAIPGAELTIPNTIDVPITIVLGVDSVNNPSPATSVGINEESDAQLRVRRQKSVSLASQGYLAGLIAALENINGITSAFVYENTTATTNADGVPGHSIWVIVAGTAADADIAQAIYTKRNAGCGMFGSKSYNITQVDGTLFTIYWDVVVTRNLFVFLTVQSINGTTQPAVQAIRDGLPLSFTPGVNQEANGNGIATLVQDIDPNTFVQSVSLSLGETQQLTLTGVPASGTFKISYNGNDSATINWNDNLATLLGKVQAITGLSAVTATGSLASQSVIFDLSALSDVATLLTVKSNTLQTSGPVAIVAGITVTGSSILQPPTKQNQLILTSSNIIITPMQLLPSASTVVTAATVQFFAYGGYGAYVYSISVNNSGGSINASTGLYTAGATPSVSDTVKATDTRGNTATATVLVG